MLRSENYSTDSVQSFKSNFREHLVVNVNQTSEKPPIFSAVSLCPFLARFKCPLSRGIRLPCVDPSTLETAMAVTDRITMTMRELDRFNVIQSVVDGLLSRGVPRSDCR
ncbi:hypothetical protein SBC2_76000 (plasmid) [Caballeronia sp. SBC2]|nr:hypothetical protein SBC2_76000 [Caballeronia sp. SBC2]